MPTRRLAPVPSKGDRRQQRLLDAAERLLATGRFAEAPVSELATEAGISRASFYFYFASKQDLLGAVVGAAVDAFSTRLAGQVSEAGRRSAADVVADTVRAATDLWTDHRVVLVASVELGSAQPEVYARNMRSVAEVSATTRALLRRSGYAAATDDELEVLVPALVLMTERNFYHLAREDPPRADYEELAALLTSVWLRALRLDGP